MVLSYFFDLVLVYRFLPALWASVSALTLFYVVYKKTGSFQTGLFSMVFFASLKSNVNLLGLWFFTPLSFSIPFIYLYVYFFTEGLLRRNKKFILASLGLMVFLIPFHAVSVLFAIPFLALYSLIHFRYVFREWRFFTLFLIIPVVGVRLFTLMIRSPFIAAMKSLLLTLQFTHGWGLFEVSNSPFELYSRIGYVLAFVGILIILKSKKMRVHVPYVLWPLCVLISIGVYRYTGVSYLSPYQRNLYYFALSLPFLSAIVLSYVLGLVRNINLCINVKNKGFNISKTFTYFLFVIVLVYAFGSYYKVPDGLILYAVINEGDYEALRFLSTQPDGRVISNPYISTASYPISGKEPVGSLSFYSPNKQKIAAEFFLSEDCETQKNIIRRERVSYIVYREEVECSWNKIYNGKTKVYATRNEK